MTTVFATRLGRLRTAMTDHDVDVILLSVGADLPYFAGYEAMPLERLTMLVVPRDGTATLVVPELEAPRVVERPDVFVLRPYAETADPIGIVVDLTRRAATIGVGDQMWSRFLVELLGSLPGATFRRAVELTGPIRSVKDADEVETLARAAAAADVVAGQLQAGAIPLIGRTEAEVSAELGQRLLEEGHRRVNFAIVAAGANAASPHHEPGTDVIEAGQVVLCDFGATMPDAHGVPYCSDITRCVWLGEVPDEFDDLYRVLHDAQRSAVASATVGTPCEEVDRVARDAITAAGYGEYFVHRTGHGIGVEAHEDPYVVKGNTTPLEPGHAFSVEPGIYIPGRWGARLEDIVVAAGNGPRELNRADHALVALDI